MSEPLTILGWPHQPDGSGYYRFWLPFEYLARFSDLRVALPDVGGTFPFTPHGDDLEIADVLVGQRWMFDGGIDSINSALRRGLRIVYELDDDILHPDSSSRLPHLFSEETQASIKTCLNLAHMVTVSTEPLAEVMREYSDN